MDSLQALFTGREKHLEAVDHAHPEGGVQQEAIRLIAQCEELGIKGVNKLGSDVGSPDKFMSILSEVRTAILFARLGAKVSILQDGAFGRPRKNLQPYYAPDLSVTFGDLNILVEVFHANRGAPDVGTPLHRGIEKRGLPFRVAYHLGSDLSVPGFGREQREKHEMLVKQVVEEALDKLSALPFGSTGEIQVGEHRFLYEPSTLELGYAAGFRTAVHWINAEEHERRLLIDLERKAQRRARLPPHLERTPFVVACVSEEWELMERNVLSALTGGRIKFLDRSPPPISHPADVMAAWNCQWQPLLQEWDYGPDAELRLQDYGAFHREEWAKNLSAVMVVHGPRCLRGPKIQWLPNPFAADAIREVRLLDIGLSIDKGGGTQAPLLA